MLSMIETHNVITGTPALHTLSLTLVKWMFFLLLLILPQNQRSNALEIYSNDELERSGTIAFGLNGYCEQTRSQQHRCFCSIRSIRKSCAWVATFELNRSSFIFYIDILFIYSFGHGNTCSVVPVELPTRSASVCCQECYFCFARFFSPWILRMSHYIQQCFFGTL